MAYWPLYSHTKDNPSRWNSHVRNLYDELAPAVAYAHYSIGITWDETAVDADEIHDDLLATIKSEYFAAPNDSKPLVAIVGWSRGGMIAMWIANDLARVGIPVDFAGLYDPVDSAWDIPNSENVIEDGIRRVASVGSADGSANKDQLYFNRETEELVKRSTIMPQDF